MLSWVGSRCWTRMKAMPVRRAAPPPAVCRHRDRPLRRLFRRPGNLQNREGPCAPAAVGGSIAVGLRWPDAKGFAAFDCFQSLLPVDKRALLSSMPPVAIMHWFRGAVGNVAYRTGGVIAT